MTKAMWFLNYVLWSLADLVLTLRGLSLGHVELNPIARWTIDTGGTLGLVTYKVALVASLVYLVVTYWNGKFARYLGYAALTLLVLTVVNNVLQVM